MKKNYVLDTNVLLHDPNAINSFKDCNVIIPLTVLEEVDNFKRELTERGRNARQLSRQLDELRNRGRLSDGVTLDNGGSLRVLFPGGAVAFAESQKNDDIILNAAHGLKTKAEEPTILISKDINMRLKADAIGLDAEDYESGQIKSPEFHCGYIELEVDSQAFSQFEHEHRLPMAGDEMHPNLYIILEEQGNPGHQALGRYNEKAKCIVPLVPLPSQMHPIHPRNTEQRFAMDALMNDEIRLVTLTGKAGTGKTLLAVAAGFFKTVDEGTYTKLLVSRPTLPMGRDLGYLPGDLEEKLNPWMQPIQDALDLVRTGRKASGKSERDFQMFGEKISVEPLTYIRGRSIPNQFIIIDETQNLTPLEVKTIITRVGHDTKIILTGDIYQIDNPYVDILSNGLNAVAEKFRPHSVAAHVMLKTGVRSELAELAANIL